MAAFGGGGFGSRGGFGQSTSAFGTSAFGSGSAPFGGQSAFGSQSNPLFGSQPQSFSSFGQSAPFGGSTFGAQSAPAFGSGFGGQSTAAFGSGFGIQSGSAFGASGGFGSSSALFGANRPPTGAFGSSTPFGQSQSAWGQSSSAFGGSTAFGSGGGIFGSSAPANSVFGQTAGAFGAGSQGQRGTAGVTWQITTEYDGGPGQSSKYHSITMMAQLRDRSIEELRVEDYASGNRGGNQGGVGDIGNPQSAGLFGNAGNTFGTSTGGFGSGSVFGNTGGFGATSSAGGFGQSSGGGVFGGGGFGASSGFGQSSGGFGDGNTFGAQSGGGIFGQPGSTFGGQSGGGFGNTGASLFGSGSGFGNQQSGGLFGAAGGGGFGGAQQTQPSFGGGNTQSGLFGAPAQPAGNTAFGAQSTPSLFGGNTAQPNMFGGGSSGFNNAGGQKPLFGSSGGNPFGSTTFGASAPGNAGGVSFGGFNAGQSAANTGFGFGGAQTGQQQAQFPQSFGASVAPGGQAFGAAPGVGYNPTLQGTFAAVTQQHGATVAPPGANYGTVLYNLQKLQSEIGEHKKLLEQQAKATAANAPKPPGTVSVVVLPSPSLFNFAGGRGRSSVSGYGWSGSMSQRTRTRGVAGRIGGTAARVSGTPVRSSPEGSADGIPATPPASSASVVRRMSFFSPHNFSEQLRPRTVRASELPTPIPATTKMLPLPEIPGTRASAGSEEERATTAIVLDEEALGSRGGQIQEDLNSRPRGHVRSILPAERNGSRSSGESPRSAGNGHFEKASPSSRTENGSMVESKNNIATRRRSRSNSNGGAGDSDFIWAQQRPSTWSLNRAVDSDDQYNPHKYLPSQTRPGFYTVPSMAELAARTMTELQQVENFTVGREGYGEITWVDPVDVRGLDLDVVVEIQRGEIAVYPEKEAEQLDAPARVKLEGMFTKKKKAGDMVSDEERNARYKQKLYNYCSRNNLHFIDYDASKGEWLFEVQTFAD